MPGHRIERVAELIKETLGDLFSTIKDPRMGFATITDAEVAPDLSSAHVFVSILGSDKERNDTLIALESASGFLQKELAREIRLRKTPRIIFKYDPGIERGTRLVSIINKVIKEDEAHHAEASVSNKEE